MLPKGLQAVSNSLFGSGEIETEAQRIERLKRRFGLYHGKGKRKKKKGRKK